MKKGILYFFFTLFSDTFCLCIQTQLQSHFSSRKKIKILILILQFHFDWVQRFWDILLSFSPGVKYHAQYLPGDVPWTGLAEVREVRNSSVEAQKTKQRFKKKTCIVNKLELKIIRCMVRFRFCTKALTKSVRESCKVKNEIIK